MIPTLNVFIGHPLNGSIGQWLNLPVKETVLKTFMDSRETEEYIISCYESNLQLDREIREYTDIFVLNDLFQDIENIYFNEANENFKLLATAISITDSVEQANELLINGNYHFFEDVSNDNELGLAIVEAEYIEIPQHLEKYFDHEALGRDWSCNGTIIDTQLSCAMSIIYEQ